MSPLERVVSALHAKGLSVRGSGNNLAAQCPSHDDRVASLCIGESSNGDALIFCQAGCSTKDVCSALGIELAELFARPLVGAGAADANGTHTNGTNGAAVYCKQTSYSIRNADDVEIAVHHRIDQSDGVKKMWWARNGKNSLDGLSVRDLPLYGTELLRAQPMARVVITEGEKACDALRRRELPDTLVLATVTGAGGKTAKAPSIEVLRVLKDRDVILWPDDDDVGRQHMMVVARSLRGIARSVRTIDWRGPEPKCDAADYTAPNHELIELLAGGAETSSKPAPAGGVILVGTDILETTQQALAAIAKASPGILYRRAGVVVQVRESEDSKTAPPLIAAVKGPRLREIMAASASWQVATAKGEYRACLPPQWAVETILSRPEWPTIPVINGVSEIPILRPDGTIAQTPGFDEPTGVLYTRPSPSSANDGATAIPPIPDEPTVDEVQECISSLRDMIHDFAFVNDVARTAALAAVLSIVGRHAIDGPVPMFHFGAPTRGSGKTLLATACSTMATGRSPSIMAPAKDDTERAKEILAIGLAGDPVVLIDNIEGSFGSPVMAGVLTKPQGFQGRLLGVSEIARVPLRCVWMSTGNNTSWVGDLGRRVVPVDQDPKTEDPENRHGFRHSPLLPAVRAAHPRLAAAALTILRAHAVAGRPSMVDSQMGSFESWDLIVRSALIWAGASDPCEGRKRIAENSDSDVQDLAQVLGAWRAAWAPLGGRPVTVAQVVARCVSYMRAARDHTSTSTASQLDSDLTDAMRTICPTGELDARTIGKWLQHRADRIVRGMRFVREHNSASNVAAWRVETV